MPGDRLIRYLCVAPTHRRSTELGLTRHEGQWALCPDLLSPGHEWTDTGGLEVSDAVGRWKQLIGLDGARHAA